jgi:hypothetical protein
VSTLGGRKTCVEVSTWDSRVWIELYPGGWSEACGLFECRLGRQQCGQEEHIRLLFQLGFRSYFLIQWEAEISCFELSRD